MKREVLRRIRLKCEHVKQTVQSDPIRFVKGHCFKPALASFDYSCENIREFDEQAWYGDLKTYGCA
jgi:hypothetical protein